MKKIVLVLAMMLAATGCYATDDVPQRKASYAKRYEITCDSKNHSFKMDRKTKGLGITEETKRDDTLAEFEGGDAIYLNEKKIGDTKAEAKCNLTEDIYVVASIDRSRARALEQYTPITGNLRWHITLTGPEEIRLYKDQKLLILQIISNPDHREIKFDGKNIDLCDERGCLVYPIKTLLREPVDLRGKDNSII